MDSSLLRKYTLLPATKFGTLIPTTPIEYTVRQLQIDTHSFKDKHLHLEYLSLSLCLSLSLFLLLNIQSGNYRSIDTVSRTNIFLKNICLSVSLYLSLSGSLSLSLFLYIYIYIYIYLTLMCIICITCTL